MGLCDHTGPLKCCIHLQDHTVQHGMNTRARCHAEFMDGFGNGITTN
jgi:hypothetical protein